MAKRKELAKEYSWKNKLKVILKRGEDTISPSPYPYKFRNFFVSYKTHP